MIVLELLSFVFWPLLVWISFGMFSDFKKSIKKLQKLSGEKGKFRRLLSVIFYSLGLVYLSACFIALYYLSAVDRVYSPFVLGAGFVVWFVVKKRREVKNGL